jgi:hypothetical protein
VLFLIVGASPALGQIDEIDDLLRGGPEDARLLIDAYLAPGVTGFEAGLHTGWGGSATVRDPFGVYLNVIATLTRVPDGDRTFTIEPAALDRFALENGAIGASPTLAGDEDGPTYVLRLPSGDRVEMPEGSGFSFVPVPLIEAGVGGGRGTDLMLRLVPPTNIEDYGELSLLGVGLKHALNQWLPGGDRLPVDLAASVQYTRFRLNAALDEEDNQDLDGDTDAWSLNVLAGRRLPVVSVYGGLGVETASTTLALLGPYDVEDPDGTVRPVEDPLDVDFGRDTALRGLAGLQVRAAVVRLFVEGTVSTYSSVTAGLGIDAG